MPDVYDSFYNLFDKTTGDFYDLVATGSRFCSDFRTESEVMDIPANFDAVCALFEQIEAGSAVSFKRKFIAEGEFKYLVGMQDMVYKPGHSATEFFSFQLFKDALRLQLFTSFSKHVRKYFKDPRLLALIEFPDTFLRCYAEGYASIVQPDEFFGT
jgi:phytoene desaturase